VKRWGVEEDATAAVGDVAGLELIVRTDVRRARTRRQTGSDNSTFGSRTGGKLNHSSRGLTFVVSGLENEGVTTTADNPLGYNTSTRWNKFLFGFNSSISLNNSISLNDSISLNNSSHVFLNKAATFTVYLALVPRNTG